MTINLGIFWVTANFNPTATPSSVPLYSFDSLDMRQRKVLDGGTLLRLAFIRRSVTVGGGSDGGVVQGGNEIGWDIK